jgi:hypothetical protein
MLAQYLTGAQRRPKATLVDTIQKRIDVLNQRYNNKQINSEELLNGLSLLIARRK